ncbi:spore germination protein [Clostridium thailandense]|uniref:spore germination protein n=1 Tax=Clostridium thailandense TaxID=2794346 RepID=UPI00398993D7
MMNNNLKNMKLSKVLTDNINKLKTKLNDCPDVIWKRIYLNNNKEGYFIYIEGLVDVNLTQRDFINPIILMKYEEILNQKNIENIPASNIYFVYDLNEILQNIVSGITVFILDGMDYAVCCESRKFEKRSVDEPETEKNVKGPHEGFIEDLKVNMSILRKRIRNNNLKFKTLKLGTTTHQNAVIAYIEDIANPKLIDNLYNKMNAIDYDGLLATGYIQQLITDFKKSPFPQYQATERPDRAIAALMEGRLVILLDITPVALIVPVNFFAFFTAFDDYSINWLFGSFLGLLRFFALIIAIFLPGLYIAITTFHYYMIPLNLLVPLAESRSRVFLPPILEALVMEITIEFLREAAIRLPTYVGSSIGIVGGIVIGQAAVQAGIVSDLLIIIVSVTAIASFVQPTYDMSLAIRFIRFIIMIFSSIFGIVGIVICGAMIIAHLVVLESLGQPYFQPIIPLKMKDLKDTIIRAPLNLLKKRPEIAKPLDKRRGKNNGE